MRFERNGKNGYKDENAREVIAPKYDSAWWFVEGIADVQLNGKWGFIDKTGREVIPLKYDAHVFKNGRAQVALDEERFWIDKAGNRVE